jgi:Fur family iron response transcriptional regulator
MSLALLPILDPFQKTSLVIDFRPFKPPAAPYIQSMTTTRPYARAVGLLKAKGLRTTRQRIALAKLLFETGADRHLTAEQLHDEVLGQAIRVSLATVYNTLHQFTDAGLLREVVVDPGRSYFDTNTTEHHHFYFEDTGRLQDIAAEAVELACLPRPPDGARVRRVDVIIRLTGDPFASDTHAGGRRARADAPEAG